MFIPVSERINQPMPVGLMSLNFTGWREFSYLEWILEQAPYFTETSGCTHSHHPHSTLKRNSIWTLWVQSVYELWYLVLLDVYTYTQCNKLCRSNFPQV